MARYKIECCLNCQKRSGGCHSTCEEYKKQRAELDETNAEILKKKETQKSIDTAMFDSMDKYRKTSDYRRKRRRKC